jgi:NADP-dependent 3-hydroxy acid dehydrogenase YdfG
MKDICITGAAKGLGRAIATRPIDDGYRVVAVDVQAGQLDALGAEFGDRVRCIPLDVSDYSSVEKMMQSVESDSLYGLVNNAGIYLGKNILDCSIGELESPRRQPERCGLLLEVLRILSAKTANDRIHSQHQLQLNTWWS